MDFEDVLVDLEPDVANFRREITSGLAEDPPNIPCKFYYDARGSELFEQICELPEYYPTRTEVGILEAHAGQISQAVGPGARVIEYGSGSGQKTELLLHMLEAPTTYVPIEISVSALRACYQSLSSAFPELPIVPMCADYTNAVALPDKLPAAERNVVFFPGSTIGNFEPARARVFLARTAELVGDDGGLVIGVDLVKDDATLEAAYNDAQGVTAAFNLNVLRRANRELDADFDLDAFEHRAVFNRDEHRIEMHLVSTERQTVSVAGESFDFDAGDHIVTEYSYKYRPDDFQELASSAGFEARNMWSDKDDLFSVWYLEHN
ncbi:MAG: L-histidine N(alpha)-methyltransferase [Myxococcota bacterium]